MKNAVGVFVLSLSFLACQDNESTKSEFTGNETTYALQAGSTYDISGTVTFKEKVGGSTVVIINLTGTEGNLQHPVHLHLGDLSTDGAAVAALLNPVLGKTGKSETTLTKLEDETTITYNQIIALEACVKIHLAEAGPDRDIILAGGNIGSSKGSISGRQDISVCKSE
ncbi:MAG TPA: hypothetical protein PLJ60_06535 [Chryseolinea sp.]|nr:hypothetical protein [Chryseolinea sp.]